MLLSVDAYRTSTQRATVSVAVPMLHVEVRPELLPHSYMRSELALGAAGFVCILGFYKRHCQPSTAR